MNWKQIGLLAFLGLAYTATAQKNYTMEEAVLGLATTLKVEDINQIGFPKQSNQYQKVEDNYLILTAWNGKADTLLSLNQINENTVAGTEKIKNFPRIQWLSATSFYYQIKNVIYKATKSKNTYLITQWYSLEDNATNVVVNDVNGILTYTLDNNLKAILPSGTQFITNESNKNIISGEAVHRHEFGIDKGVFQSPKGNKIAYYRMDQSMVADYPIINWKVNPAQNENIKYPMAGGITHEVSLGVYNIHSGRTVFLATPQPLKDYYLTGITWSPDEKHIYVGVLTRNQRALELHQYDAETGALVSKLLNETDDKYVEPQNPLYFLPGGKEFVWWSQRDGYMHLYRYNTEGKYLGAITQGDWLVKSIDGVNEKKSELIITTTKGDARETSIYAVNYKTGKMRQLSQTNASHSAMVSADGTMLLDAYRNSQNPKSIQWIQTQTGKSQTLLKAANPLLAYNNAKVENVNLTADDGTVLYGKIMLPYNFDKNKKYPVVYYLYNGPHLQLITNSFPESGNLWYDYLTQNGYIVFSMDGRGSSNRGLEFEQAIHNHLATIEMQDHMKGVQYLQSLPYVDAERMGIHGWSYGGFMTTSFMTRNPGVFKAGVAGGPVIDWKQYEIMYTERYMSSPQDNPDGYEENNLLNYAKNLKGKLLMIHGTDDDVVVWQHSIDFVRKCVDEKVQVDYFVYPGHPHNVRGKDRVHLMQKVTDYFDEHLK